MNQEGQSESCLPASGTDTRPGGKGPRKGEGGGGCGVQAAASGPPTGSRYAARLLAFPSAPPPVVNGKLPFRAPA